MDNRFVFISDFDGTMSDKDFYQILMDKYLGEEGKCWYRDWRAGKYLDKDFLNKVYSLVDRSEEELMEDIHDIRLDEYIKEFIERVKAKGGEFVILSAGTGYYIERVLELNNITGVRLYTNKGVYYDRGIHLEIDKESEFYSERYGIDKAKVVSAYKEKYDRVYFAGDSQPDIAPCLLADMAFAKNTLIPMLEKDGIPHIPVKNFREIADYLTKEGIL